MHRQDSGSGNRWDIQNVILSCVIVNFIIDTHGASTCCFTCWIRLAHCNKRIAPQTSMFIFNNIHTSQIINFTFWNFITQPQYFIHHIGYIFFRSVFSRWNDPSNIKTRNIKLPILQKCMSDHCFTTLKIDWCQRNNCEFKNTNRFN